MAHLSGLDRARLALEAGRRFPGGVLPAPVAASWDRCRALGLDPRQPPEAAVLAFAEVRRRRETLAAMRRLALAEMRLLHAQIAGSEFMIALGDAEGIVLDTISDQAFADSDAGRAIIPGSRWREEDRGTNALGLAALERAPVAIHGREHYFAAHGRLSCMAAPILGPDGAVLGLIDASCANEARQQHTLALVRMAAAQVENGLLYEQFPEATILAFHPRPEYLRTLSAGLLAVGPDGEVLSLNRPAATLLAGLPLRIGARFEALFETGFAAARDALRGGGPAPIRDRAGSGLFIACPRPGAARRPPAIAARAEGPAPDFVCADPVLARRMAGIAGATRIGMPILILGETGTGKELMARHVHAASGRSGAFVALNCGAVPEALFAAELFGHARGAFTDAGESAAGLIRAADGGTLFLDEVGEIPQAAQAALLRFLDDGEARPIGATRSVRVDAQVVAATNRDLAAGHGFRRDLLYRLGGLTLELPPLRARSDFAAIVRHLARAIAEDFEPTEAEIAALAARPWPGNIRELRSTLRRAAIAGGLEAEAGPAEVEGDCCDLCRPNPLDRERCLRIRSVFAATGNVAETARRLGLSRTTVYRHAQPRPSGG
ncbi:MAG: sigma-54-dependent Fis family transcriptional regulator [Rhodovulum sulfidophilum]|uniref:Nif-specific regulatory protein n=1 Tax=Rhodovulum sulfidophilum TaxID=35806 RepID=A0A2W5NKA4_RHOSU|nr:MAG: sigma-54-dependent Fis family transcriptional regulator [Rhodovulum sulfidophilum]